MRGNTRWSSRRPPRARRSATTSRCCRSAPGTRQSAVSLPHQGPGPGPGDGAARAQPAGDLGVRAATFDGDTPGDARQAVRVHGDIVVSNPDMLHQGILPHHTKWAQFFEALRFVVIDEMHTYRGVFGSHVANVIRRLQPGVPLLSMPSRYSSSVRRPSRTPKISPSQLVGSPVHAIEESGAPAGGAPSPAMEPAGDQSRAAASAPPPAPSPHASPGWPLPPASRPSSSPSRA